jgi:hypothetical protein
MELPYEQSIFNTHILEMDFISDNGSKMLQQNLAPPYDVKS